MNNTTITTIIVVFSLFLLVVLTNTIIVYAQHVSPPSNTPTQKPAQSPSSTPSPKLHAIKIIAPTKGQQIPASKDLTISGTSIDNATSNCQVSMIVNHVKPYQRATAAGTGGTNDYSKWNFVLTSNYTAIKPGPDNRITAKYTCKDNPSMVSYSSVNVIGAVAAAAPAATTTAYPKQQQQKQQNMMTTTSNNTATTTSNGITNKIPPPPPPPQQQPSNQTENNIGNPLANIPIIGKLFGGK